MASFSTDSNHGYDPNKGNDYDGITRKIERMAWTASGMLRNLVNAINAWRASANTREDRW